MIIKSRQKYYFGSIIINWKKDIVSSIFLSKGNHYYFPNTINGERFIMRWRRNIFLEEITEEIILSKIYRKKPNIYLSTSDIYKKKLKV